MAGLDSEPSCWLHLVGRLSGESTDAGGECSQTRGTECGGSEKRLSIALGLVTVWAVWADAACGLWRQSGPGPALRVSGGRVDRGSAACLSIGSLRVDHAVGEQVLAAIQPAGIQAALTAQEQVMHGDEEKRRALELTVEKARYEARRAQRQFDAVDPDNRLVAQELSNLSLAHFGGMPFLVKEDEALDPLHVRFLGP